MFTPCDILSRQRLNLAPNASRKATGMYLMSSARVAGSRMMCGVYGFCNVRDLCMSSVIFDRCIVANVFRNKNVNGDTFTISENIVRFRQGAIKTRMVLNKLNVFSFQRDINGGNIDCL